MARQKLPSNTVRVRPLDSERDGWIILRRSDCAYICGLRVVREADAAIRFFDTIDIQDITALGTVIASVEDGTVLAQFYPKKKVAKVAIDQPEEHK